MIFTFNFDKLLLKKKQKEAKRAKREKAMFSTL